MTNYVECELYEAPSASGGKVWAVPKYRPTITVTLYGSATKFWNHKMATIREVKEKDFNDAVQEKVNKGYIRQMKSVWIDFGSGEISFEDPDNSNNSSSLETEFKHSPPESVIEIKSDGLFNF
ncbi:hypothetical protein JCM30760_26930 [Thiomicrorhabdus hydrogeniphila]